MASQVKTDSVSGFESRPNSMSPVQTLLFRLLGGTLATALIAPAVLGRFTIPRLALVAGALLFFFLIISIAKLNNEKTTLVAISIGALSVLLYFVSDGLGRQALDPLVTLNFQRFTILPLLMFACAWALIASGLQRDFLRILVVIALASSCIAIFEYVFNTWLISEQSSMTYQRGDGTFRAIAGGAHPLVLGATLACLVPLVHVLIKSRAWLGSLVLLAGCFATGSRGPLLLGIVFAVIVGNRKLWNRFRENSKLRNWIAYLGIGGLLFFSFFVFEPVASGQSGYDYSTNYRTAIYALLPAILATVPFGYGLSAIPHGAWLIDSQIFGVRDLTDTVDSELVLLVLNFGVLGLVAYISVFVFSVRMVQHASAMALSLLGICISGLTLAIHAWDSLGPLWYLMIGLTYYARNDERIQSEVSQ